MICWNYGRPDENGVTSREVKNGMIGVVIHEVGHNFFPMIVNSDERQWTWMDEGLNSFLEYLAEQELDPTFPSRRGPAKNIVPYMSGDQKFLEPIMSNSETIHQFGNNAYGKPATGLNILREVVMEENYSIMHSKHMLTDGSLNIRPQKISLEQWKMLRL